MGADNHKTVRPTNAPDPREEVRRIEPPEGDENMERLYQIWMAAGCRTREPSRHQLEPTFMYVTASDDEDAFLKSMAIAAVTDTVRCACQVQARERELYV